MDSSPTISDELLFVIPVRNVVVFAGAISNLSIGREFSGKRLKELTVHHKDHDHDNNPPDGSNWELLCIYCHDHEHDKIRHADHVGTNRDDGRETAPGLGNPFAALDGLLAEKED